MERGIGVPGRARPTAHDLAVANRIVGLDKLADRDGAIARGKRGFLDRRWSAEPPLHDGVYCLRSRFVVDPGAQTGEMRSERLCGTPVAIGMLHRIHVDDDPVITRDAYVFVLTKADRLEEPLTALRSVGHDQAAARAGFAQRLVRVSTRPTTHSTGTAINPSAIREISEYRTTLAGG